MGNKDYVFVLMCVCGGGGWRSGLLHKWSVHYLFVSHVSCDADPAALAKYVVALLRKDKPKSDLKDLCVDQLEVFLAKGEHCLNMSQFAVMSMIIRVK